MTPHTGASGRVVGVDVARCLALVGMIATHVLPSVVDGEVRVAHQVAAGRASALFAVLAGTSLVLIVGSRRPVHGQPLRGMVAGTVVRAALIGVVGLVLGEMNSGIAVILCYYAVLFVVAVPFLALPTGWVVGIAAGWAVAGPVVSHLLRSQLPLPSYAVPSFGSLLEPATLLLELLVTGYYPVLTWVPYVLLGMVVGRLDLRSRRVAAGLAAFGSWAVAVSWTVSDALTARPDVRAALIRGFEGAGWRGDLSTTLADGLYGVTPTGSPWWLVVRAPHTGATFDLLMTGGSACLVLAACLVAGRSAPRVLGVLFGAGAMTLTLYSLHVVLRSPGLYDGDDTNTFVGHVVLVLTIGAIYRLGRQRGPLETVVGDSSRAVQRAVESPSIGSVP